MIAGRLVSPWYPPGIPGVARSQKKSLKVVGPTGIFVWHLLCFIRDVAATPTAVPANLVDSLVGSLFGVRNCVA